MISTKEGRSRRTLSAPSSPSPGEKELQGKQAEISDLSEKLQRGANTMSQTAQDDIAHHRPEEHRLQARVEITVDKVKNSASFWTIWPRRGRP